MMLSDEGYYRLALFLYRHRELLEGRSGSQSGKSSIDDEKDRTGKVRKRLDEDKSFSGR